MHLKIKFFFSLFIKKVFFPCTDQIQCCPFLEEKKNIKQIFISNLIFVDCSLMLYIRKVSANFQPKKYSFLRSLWFFQSENIAARAAKFADIFGIGLIKIYLIGSLVPTFKNRKKFYITPPYLARTIFIPDLWYMYA